MADKLIEMLGGGKFQQNDVSDNWLNAAMWPVKAARDLVMGSGSPAGDVLRMLGVQGPPKQKLSVNDLLLDAGMSTAGVVAPKLPQGFYHNILKQLDSAATGGQIGKQAVGQTPRGGMLFNALQKQQVSGEELGTMSKLRGSSDKVNVADVQQQVAEQLPELEKRIMKKEGALTASWKTPRWETYSVEDYDPGSYSESLWYYKPKQTTSKYDTIQKEMRSLEAELRILAKQPAKNWVSSGARERYEQINRRYAELEREEQHVLANGVDETSYHEDPVHFGNDLGKNLLMWSRTNERTLPSGERVAFLEEAQSGWHTKGSQEGYSVGADINGPKVYIVDRRTGERLNEGAMYSPEEAREAFNHEQGGMLNDQYQIVPVPENELKGAGGVPDAPLKKDWYKPLMRDLVADAVHKGLDGVAWTGSDIQVKRWSEKYRKFYEQLYDSAIPKFMKNEFGAAPVRKSSSVNSALDSPSAMEYFVGVMEIKGYDLVDVPNGMFAIFGPDQRVLDYTRSNNQADSWRKLSDIINKQQNIWYLPITPAVRKRVLEEGQRISKNESDQNIMKA